MPSMRFNVASLSKEMMFSVPPARAAPITQQPTEGKVQVNRTGGIRLLCAVCHVAGTSNQPKTDIA